MKSFYDIIEIEETANFDDVKKAYFRFLRAEHPDKNPQNKSSSATELLKAVGQIWEQVKSNRVIYDSWLREQRLRETQGTIGETIELERNQEIEEYCRCGAEFNLTQEEVDQIIDVGIFECSSCSLCLEIRRP